MKNDGSPGRRFAIIANKESTLYCQRRGIMIKILQNQNSATRFRVMVEIAANQPNIQQKDIARRLEVTPQAISDYIAQLIKDGFLTSDGRSRYRATNKGVNWIVRMLREIRNYTSYVEKVITNISVCTAIAECELSKGETAGLKMKNGILYATSKTTKGAKGTVTSDAGTGQDVGVTNITGIVELKLGTVTILKVPNVSKGGSRSVDLTRLRGELKGKRFIGALGIEAMVALKQLKVNFHSYGAQEAAIEAAHCGLQPVVTCTEDQISGLIRRLEEADIGYTIVDMAKK
jgi:putative transcriptional regulator